MKLQKNIKDIVYDLLQEPTLEKFREFMQSNTGEHNSIDFKQIWIEKSTLAKEVLSIANSGGGVIVFGVKETSENAFEPIGLESLKGKEQVSNELKNIISSNLKYEIHDFEYTSSEYEKLKDKNFQILVIEDTPEHLPFISKKEAGADGKGKIHEGIIYVRRGTSCEKATEQDVGNLIQRRMNFIFPKTGKPLNLEEHLEQLKLLYSKIERYTYTYEGGLEGLAETFSTLINFSTSIFGNEIEEINPLYPDESYEEYLSRLLSEKKKKIERVLDLY